MSSSIAFSGSEEGKHQSHIVGIFLGVTSFDEDDGRETETTYGVEYEFRFHKHISLGLVYETSPDAHHEDGVDVKLVGIHYRPDSHWRFTAGIGEEEIGGDHPHTETLRRLGVAYDFHVGGFGIAPTVNADFVDGHTVYVGGVVFSKSF